MSGLDLLLSSCVSLFLVGIAIFAIFAEIRRVRRLGTWTRLTAEIVSSRVTEDDDPETGTTFNVEVEYQYEVNGSSHKRTVSLMAVSNQFLKHAESLCASHPPGAEFPIVYDPKNPAESEMATPADFRMELVLFLIFIIGLVYLMIRSALSQ